METTKHSSYVKLVHYSKYYTVGKKTYWCFGHQTLFERGFCSSKHSWSVWVFYIDARKCLMGLLPALIDSVSLNLSLSLAALWNLSAAWTLMQIHKEDYRCGQPPLHTNLLTRWAHWAEFEQVFKCQSKWYGKEKFEYLPLAERSSWYYLGQQILLSKKEIGPLPLKWDLACWNVFHNI